MNCRVVHTVSGLKNSSGGVARSIPSLCEALAAKGCGTTLVSQMPHRTSRGELRLPAAEAVDTRLIQGYDWARLRLSFTPHLLGYLEDICRTSTSSVLHDHGMWLHMNHTAAVVARRLGLKRVVSPRGTLEAWPMRYRRWKKALAWRMYQHRDLRWADAFSVTSASEAAAIRKLGMRQPIAVIPNGVLVPEVGGREATRSRARTVLFMSRIHPKKGLIDLVEAWANLGKTEWRLVIAGPDEDGYRRVVEEAVARSGAGATVRFAGHVEGAAKDELLRSAHVFVLPSYSENFGIVVGEALAHAVPVITTTATPWECLESERCGCGSTPAQALSAQRCVRQWRFQTPSGCKWAAVGVKSYRSASRGNTSPQGISSSTTG